MSSWQKQATCFEKITWVKTNVAGLNYAVNIKGRIAADNLAFFFENKLVDFKGFPRIAEDVQGLAPKVETKSVVFRGCEVVLEFNSTWLKKDFVQRAHDIDPEQNYKGDLYKRYTDVYLKVFEKATGRQIAASGILAHQGLYRLIIDNKELYFGEIDMIKRLLIEEQKMPVIHKTVNPEKIKVGAGFRLVVVDANGNKSYVENEGAIVELIINGRNYSLAVDKLIKGYDHSTEDKAFIRFPNYSLRLFEDSSTDEFNINALASDITRIDINGQSVFVYAQPL
jgi:hypothetical protein